MTTSIGSGLGSSFGTGIESSYGTAVTPTRWTTPTKHEIDLTPQFVQGQGLRQGVMVEDVYDRVWSAADAGGSVEHPVYRNGMGQLIGSLMGSLVTGAPVQQGSSAAYLQTHALAPQQGQSLTIQEGVPDAGTGLLHLWITQGAKVTQGQFTSDVGSLLTATFTIDGQDRIESDSAPTSPTLLTGNQVFGFPNLVVKVGAYGSEAQVDGVQKFDATIKRAESDKRFNIGNVTSADAGYAIKDEPIDNAFFDISGTLSTEFIDTSTFVDVFMSQTSFSLIATWTGPVIASSYHYSFEIAFPCCRYTGTTPTVPGPDIVQPSMPFIVLNDDSHTPATITIQCTDSAL